ncbi:MAG: copper amine oxidase N-terminal domain-containing protein [Oscillospiraceae bacterium]|nr:copper amine oxidase N-terminal domain-containing protein [Oscillospiraceae bacterium]
MNTKKLLALALSAFMVAPLAAFADEDVDDSNVVPVVIGDEFFTDSQDFLDAETVKNAQLFYVDKEEDIREEITFTKGEVYLDSDSRMRVPLRDFAEQMGYSVHWYEETGQIVVVNNENSKKWFTFTAGDNIVSCYTQNFIEYTTGHMVMDCSPIIIDGVTYIPLRHIANILNYNVVWDEKTLTAELYDSAAIPVGGGVLYYDLTYAEPVAGIVYTTE